MASVNLKKVTSPLIKWIKWSLTSWGPEHIQLVYFVFNREIFTMYIFFDSVLGLY